MTEEKKKIMLVEDDAFIRDIYEVKFKQDNFDAVLAENGLDAIKKLENFLPDLVLVDIVMPYMDGIDFLQEFRKNEKWKNIPVIMLSNLSDKKQLDDVAVFGVSEYLIKSHFTPSEVVDKINRLLHK